MPQTFQLDAEREDKRAAVELGRFLSRLVLKPGLELSVSQTHVFRMTERWTFVPTPTPSGLLTILNGTWRAPTRNDVYYNSVLSNDGRSVSIETCGGGILGFLGCYRPFIVYLGMPDECRTRGASMLRSLPYWVDGPIEERIHRKIGHDSVESIIPFAFKLGDGVLQCLLKGFSTWNDELGEDRYSPQAHIQFQLLHKVQGTFADVFPDRTFVNVNTDYTGATVDISYPNQDPFDPTAVASLLHFVTLYYINKTFGVRLDQLDDS